LILSVLFNFDVNKLKFLYRELIGKETKFRAQNIIKRWLYNTQLKKIIENSSFETIIDFIKTN